MKELTFHQRLALHGLKWFVGSLIALAAACYLADWLLDTFCKGAC